MSNQEATSKRPVRARQKEHGEKYTVAMRAVQKELGPELHYRFTPPETIERGHRSGVRELEPPEQAGPSFTWGYSGSGPATSAWAVLEDASGDADQCLAIECLSDNLDWSQLLNNAFVSTAAEVKAWRGERESDIRKIPVVQTFSPQDLAEMMIEHLTDPDRLTQPRFEVYRQKNPLPRL